ncbi:hypothetical protein [Azospirillum agricola]|nr:hypothetical protein [Azospirillum agricola]SMH38029.1 hypothetical protein SAMN02982994_1257 [Azospirillum lipoferum]
MAKGQKRGNREIRKPKAAKPVAAMSVATFLNKKETTSERSPRKKG